MDFFFFLFLKKIILFSFFLLVFCFYAQAFCVLEDQLEINDIVKTLTIVNCNVLKTRHVWYAILIIVD